MNLIIALGGTGQMIAHYYVQLYLLGLVKPFKCVLFDTDEISPALKITKAFLERVQVAQSAGMAESVSKLDILRIAASGESEIARDLTGLAEKEVPARHAARALFSRDTLIQTTSKGLYFRPAMVDVLAYQDVVGANLPKLEPDNNSNVVIVGSIIGGTGGGLMAPTIAAVQEAATARQNVSLRAVLLGQYFRPDPDEMAEAGNRFASNKVLVAKTLQQRDSDLHSYAFIEEPRMEVRQTSAEKASRGLQWPGFNQPYWKAVAALEHLLTSSTRDVRGHFEDREVPNAAYQNSITHDKAEARLEQRLSVVNALVDEQVIRRISAEAFTHWVWGQRLVDFVAGYWRIAGAHIKGDDLRSAQFPGAVQDAADRLWQTGITEDRYGMMQVFPAIAKARASVEQVRDTGWPLAPDATKPDGFPSWQQAAETTAALLLFHALQGGPR